MRRKEKKGEKKGEKLRKKPVYENKNIEEYINNEEIKKKTKGEKEEQTEAKTKKK